MANRLTRATTWVLAIAVLVSAAGVLYISANPGPTTDPYTEFYVLGPGGNASNYPTTLPVGDTGEVIAGITNHEYQQVEYTLMVVLGNRTVTTRSITVGDKQTVERSITFIPRSPDRMRLQLLLYKGPNPANSSEADQVLRLWVTGDRGVVLPNASAGSRGLDPTTEEADVTQEAPPSESPGEAPATLDVVSLRAPSSVSSPVNVRVGATVTNPSDEPVTEILKYRFAGRLIDTRIVTVAPGETTMVWFQGDINEREPGSYYHGVFARETGKVEQITLLEPSRSDVLDAPSPVQIGETSLIEARVSNLMTLLRARR